MTLRNVLTHKNLPLLLTVVFWSRVSAGLQAWGGAYARDDDYPELGKFWASERDEDYPDLSKLFSSNEEPNTNDSHELKPEEDFFISFHKDRSLLKENELDESGQANDRPWMKGKMAKVADSQGGKAAKENKTPLGNEETDSENESSVIGDSNREPYEDQKTISNTKNVENNPYSKNPGGLQGDRDSVNSKNYHMNSQTDERIKDENVSSNLTLSDTKNVQASRTSSEDNKMPAPSLNGDKMKGENSGNNKPGSPTVQDQISKLEGNISKGNSKVTGDFLHVENNNQFVPQDEVINIGKEDMGKLDRQSYIGEGYSEESGRGRMLKNLDQSSLPVVKDCNAQNLKNDHFQSSVSSPNRASRLLGIGKNNLNKQHNLKANENGLSSSLNYSGPSKLFVESRHKSETDEVKQNAQLPPVSYKIPDHHNLKQKSNSQSVVNSDIFAKPPIKDLVQGGRKSLNIQPIAEKPETNFESQNVDKGNNRQIQYHNVTKNHGSSLPDKTEGVRLQKSPFEDKDHVLLKKSAEKPERAGAFDHYKPLNEQEFYSFPKRNSQNSARFSSLLKKATGRYNSSATSASKSKMEGGGLIKGRLREDSGGKVVSKSQSIKLQVQVPQNVKSLPSRLREDPGGAGTGKFQSSKLHEEVAQKVKSMPSRLHDIQSVKGEKTKQNDAIPRYGNDVFAHPLTIDDPELDIVGLADNKAKFYHPKKSWALKNSPKVEREVN